MQESEFDAFIKNKWSQWSEKIIDAEFSINIDAQNTDDTRYTTNDEILRDMIEKIIKYFPREYSYKKEVLKVNQLSFYHKPFNTHDWIINIFQYLNCIKDLNSCTMVDRIWLINSFDINCTKYWHLDTDLGVLPKLIRLNSSRQGCTRRYNILQDNGKDSTTY